MILLTGFAIGLALIIGYVIGQNIAFIQIEARLKKLAGHEKRIRWIAETDEEQEIGRAGDNDK